jgi:5-methylcytosine-specific restriction endonuclease McrA
MKTCKKGHRLDGDNLASNGSGGYVCRTCRNEKARERYWANLEESRVAGRARMRKHLGPLRGNANGRKTHCPQDHEYTEENTYVAPSGNRQCKTCRKVRVMESYERHREKRTAEMRAWREANMDRVRENLRRWNEENRERANMLSRLKKHRRRASGVLTVADWELVLSIYGAACLRCGKAEVTIDHVIPTSKGGPNIISNVQPLCGWCNTSKGTKTIDYRPVPWDELAA